MNIETIAICAVVVAVVLALLHLEKRIKRLEKAFEGVISGELMKQIVKTFNDGAMRQPTVEIKPLDEKTLEEINKAFGRANKSKEEIKED